MFGCIFDLFSELEVIQLCYVHLFMKFALLCLSVLCFLTIDLFYLVNFSVEYNVSYVYHAMYAYFDRDNVALKGLAK